MKNRFLLVLPIPTYDLIHCLMRTMIIFLKYWFLINAQEAHKQLMQILVELFNTHINHKIIYYFEKRKQNILEALQRQETGHLSYFKKNQK